MFPYYNKAVRNEAYKNILRETEINSLFGGLKLPRNEFNDFREQVPLWIHQEYGTETSNFINFYQAYYDWIYSNLGYNLSINGFLELLNIDTMPIDLLRTFSKTYFASFPENLIGVPEDDPLGIIESNLRNFIKEIKTSLYHKKSTEEAFIYFLRSLFLGDEGEITIEYPGHDMFNLNDDGSALNMNALPNYEEFSVFTYIIKVCLNYDSDLFELIFPNGPSGDPIYKQAVIDVLHPVGLHLIFQNQHCDDGKPKVPTGGCCSGGGNETLVDECYITTENTCDGLWLGDNSTCEGNPCSSDDPTGACCVDSTCSLTTEDSCDGTWIGANTTCFPMNPCTCEISILGTYLPYTMNTDVSINGCTGCTLPYYNANTGSTYIGVSGGGIGGTSHVSYSFPDWSIEGACGNNFGSINIEDFLYLCSDTASPNIGRTGCTAYGCYS